MTEFRLFLFLADVVVVVVAARLGGELALRLGLAQVVGELVFGILLGPSLFGKAWPGGFGALFPAGAAQRDLLEIMSWIGVVFLVLLAGFDSRLGIVRKSGRAVLTGWIGGFALPFLLGFTAGWVIPGRLIGPGISRAVFALFLATAISISAIPVIARILMEMGIFQTRVGMVIVSTAVIDDMVGWVLIALVTGIAVNHSVDHGGLAVALVGAALFLLLAFTFGQWLVRKAFAATRNLRIPYAHATLMLVVVFTGGAITQALHLHLVLGAFVGGILIFRTPWQSRDRDTIEAARRIGMGFFAPFFFGYTGLKVDVTTLTGSTLAVATLVLGIACVGKLVGGGVGARLGGLSSWEAAAVGVGRNARGTSELVIAAIGLSIGVLTLPMYSIVVLIAVITSLMAAPLLRFCVQRSEPELPRAEPSVETPIEVLAEGG